MNSRQPKARAIGILDGRIAVVGTNEEVSAHSGPRTKVIDAKETTIIPGFCDSHLHPLLLGHLSRGVQLSGATSIPVIVDELRRASALLPKGKVLLGYGWNQERLVEGRYPTRQEIDGAVPDRPCFLIHYATHACLVNTLLMKQKNISGQTDDPEGGTIVRDERGEPTGVLLERAIELVAPGFMETGTASFFTDEDSRKALKYAGDQALEHGITTMVDVLASDPQVRLYQDLKAAGERTCRICFYMGAQHLEQIIGLGLKSGFGSDWVKFCGVKIKSDGALSNHDAALREPYADDPSALGSLCLSVESLRETLLLATSHGVRVDVHAVGDRAVETVLGLFQEINDRIGPNDPRYKLSHCLVLGMGLPKRFKELNVTASVQPALLMRGKAYVPRLLGEQRTKYVYAWKSLADEGVHVAFGSDAPVETIDPLLGIYAAVARKDLDGEPSAGWRPEQRLTAEEALRMATLEGAYAVGEERSRGSIEVGKLADLAILTDDPSSVAVELIPRIRVLITVLGGEIVYNRGL